MKSECGMVRRNVNSSLISKGKGKFEKVPEEAGN